MARRECRRRRRTMALEVTPVNRNLQTRVTFLSLEFEDLFVVLGLAAVMNLVGQFGGGEIGEIPMNLLLQSGLTLAAVPQLMAFKYRRPRAYVCDLTDLYLRHTDHSAI